MSNRDVEFAEFFAVTWARVYRTTYAVAGRPAVTQDAAHGAFTRAYADWGRVLDADDPEAEVRASASRAALKSLRKEPVNSPPTSEFGPLVPQGYLMGASHEERTRANESWAELQALAPEDRAVIALTAASQTTDGRSLGLPRPVTHGSESLVDFLVSTLDEILIPSGDLEAVMAQGSARRRRRQWVACAVAAVLIVSVAIPVALFAPQRKAASAKNVGAWREVASAPLSPRWASVASWTGTEALFIGGETDESCTARSICTGSRDGAAYNPETDTWRMIAPAPFDVARIPTVQIGDRTFMQADEGWWFYDASDDEWVQIPDPPGVKNVASMTGMQGTLYVVGTGPKGPIQAYEISDGEWSSLPQSPFRPSLERRFLVGSGDGLVVLGVDPTNKPANPAESAEFQAEYIFGDSWFQLAPSGQKAYLCCWIWTGERLVHPLRLPVFGGENRTGGLRFAGGMTLDVRTGAWGYLEEGPPDVQDTETWRLFAWNDVDYPSPLLAFNGYVYDDRDTSWTRLSRPVQAPEAETAAVWGDGRLITFGGANFGAGEDENTGTTNRAWIYTPRTP